MRIYSIVLAAISGVLMAGVSTVALAGSCADGNCGSNYNAALAPYEGVPSAVCRARLVAGNSISTCSTRSVVHAAAADPMAMINYNYSNPYGHLKTFAFKNTPDVNIMRVYARPPMAPLNAVPNNFTTGCNVGVSTHCNHKAGVVIAPPAPIVRPIMRPAPLPVVRPIARPAPIAPIAPVQIQTSNFGMTGGNVIGHVSGGSYTYQTPGTPDYWEKTSGATVVSGMPATQIVCRRAGTAGTVNTVNVVRPVIGVPTAVPVMRPTCLPASGSANPFSMAGSRWTH